MVVGVDWRVELYLGTGGYANDDWVGLLYPEQSKQSDWLGIYARHFNAVELNSSFYAIPGVKAFAGMLNKSEGKVRFAIKLHQSMTHTRDAEAGLYTRLRESVAPLREAGVLGPFLAQFPYAFKRTPANRRYLQELAQRFEGEALAVEFRHDYLYDADELRPWVAEVMARSDGLSQLYRLFQNTTKGYALKNAVTVRELFAEAGVPHWRPKNPL